VVADSGAHHGLFISASGFQAGAYEAVRHTNIRLLSWEEFQEMFVEEWCRKYWVPVFRKRADCLAGYVDPVTSDAAYKHHQGEPLEPEEAVGLMAHKMWGAPFMEILVEHAPRVPLCPAIWQLRDEFKEYLPDQIRRSEYLRDLLDLLLGFAAEWLKSTGRA
jgi:hypothetical protein